MSPPPESPSNGTATRGADATFHYTITTPPKKARKMPRRWRLWFECYQLAGGLLLAPDHLTDGQKERLTELLLNVLSEPDRFDWKLVHNLRAMAMKP